MRVGRETRFPLLMMIPLCERLLCLLAANVLLLVLLFFSRCRAISSVFACSVMQRNCEGHTSTRRQE